jgi:predicted amidohydrolase YtcJ
LSLQLFVNGVIYTLNQDKPLVSAVMVKDGRIIDLGDDSQLIKKYKNQDTELIDFQGGMVLPGLTDSHMHLISHGTKLLSLDFSQCTHAQEMKRMLQEKVSKTPEGTWIIGVGWNENNFPDRKIFTREELDECSSKHPILLSRVCSHATLVNSLALSLAGVNEATPDPAGGVIVKDDKGNLTGLLLDNASLLVHNKVPQPSDQDLKRALETAIRDCWSLGLVGGHSEDTRQCGSFDRAYKLFDETVNRENHFFRVHELVYHEYIEEMVSQGLTYGSGTPFFNIGAMKVFADGALGGRSALLSTPYSDNPTTNGVGIHTLEELKGLVKKARSHSFPIAIHAIGDQALENALDALESEKLSNGIDRIIHAQVIRHDLLERMTKANIVVDIQPRFVASDFPWVTERLGEDRIRWSYAWKTLLHAGIPCAGGSDAPIEPVNPLLGLHAAVTRVKPDEKEHDGYLAEQCLSPLEAIHLFTIGSAFAEQKSELKGTIEFGKVADFTVLDQDLFKVNTSEWLQSKVSMTVVNGNVVYTK